MATGQTAENQTQELTGTVTTLQKRLKAQHWKVSYVKILIGKKWDPETHRGTCGCLEREDFS